MNEKTKNIQNDKCKDMTKALSFLLSKENCDIPLDEKIKFLRTKLPDEVVEEAKGIYPILQNLVISNEQSSPSLFSSVFNIGMISSSILITLLINYIVDVYREKKNAYFLITITEGIKKEVDEKFNSVVQENENKFDNFVQKEKLNNEIKAQFDIYSQGKGLTVNPSLAQIKSKINEIENKTNSLNEKLDYYNMMLTQTINTEVKSRLNEYLSNNQK